MIEQPEHGRDGLPTGANTADRIDVADPHPEVHADIEKVPHPGEERLHPFPDIGPNSYAHDGTPQPKPDYQRETLSGDE